MHPARSQAVATRIRNLLPRRAAVGRPPELLEKRKASYAGLAAGESLNLFGEADGVFKRDGRKRAWTTAPALRGRC